MFKVSMSQKFSFTSFCSTAKRAMSRTGKSMLSGQFKRALKVTISSLIDSLVSLLTSFNKLSNFSMVKY